MKLLFSLFPILLLIFLMTKKKSLPSYRALPLVAILTTFISLIFFKIDATLVLATSLKGLLTALTPVMIIGGAIFLFRTMEKTGAMKIIRQWLNGLSSNKIAQLMIVGWAFEFLIEGASGFGTPAALAAPILLGLGFPALEVAIFALVMNSFPVSFGAVGTPTWFGFSGISGLSAAELAAIGWKTSLIHGAAALIIPLLALRLLVDWKSIRKNLGFIYISIGATMIPYIAVSFFNYEFPALLGGFIGLMVSVFAAGKGWGLEKTEKAPAEPDIEKPGGAALLKAFFPLWGTLLILIVTRIPALGLKGLLNLNDPAWQLSLGTLGDFSLSPALVMGLQNIFGTTASWSLKLLYVPGLIPFVLISLLTFGLYKKSRKEMKETGRETLDQLRNPFAALLGALVFVNLLMMGGEEAPTLIIGKALSGSLGRSWQFFAAYLGALGSFFSGSNTISNLTFGGIQDSIALNLGLNRTTILAMQSVGGAMGNMVCIHNIVAVCTVLGLKNSEGLVLKRTAVPMVLYGLIAGSLSFLL